MGSHTSVGVTRMASVHSLLRCHNSKRIQPIDVTPAFSSSRSSSIYKLKHTSGRREVDVSASATPPAYHDQQEPPKRLAVFVSGGGSNFRAIHAATLDGRINGSIAVVVTNNPTCGGGQYATQHGIPVITYPKGLDPEQLTTALTQEHRVDYVLLAGYLKLIPSELVRAYKRRILNIHPGLLPSFGGKGYYGQKVHEAVIASGARFSGPTIHFVDEEYDTGPILSQAVVPVYPLDTPQKLAARVLKEEHKLYPISVAALCDGRVTWRDDGVPIMWTDH